jgi:serine/threonine-protein kinase
MKLMPGLMVTPNVRLVRPLGQGAMGEVWQAEHVTLKTRVAVKFVSQRIGGDHQEAVERFAREAALAAQIQSSHVVQKFDHGVMVDGTPYIVMEYLEGEGLGELLARQPRLPLGQVVKIVWQTSKALGSAHKLGIVHRDIKPDNIFLSTRDDELHVKVFDFGVAKATQAAPSPESLRPQVNAAQGAAKPNLGITNDGVMIGTPEYMSPEQVMSARAVDHFADLWALAVVAYVALTGRLPFSAEDVGKLCVLLLEGEFPPASQVCPELPREVDPWFKRAFAKDSTQRFQSARELAQAMVQTVPMATAPSLSGNIQVPPQVRAAIAAQTASRGPQVAAPHGVPGAAARHPHPAPRPQQPVPPAAKVVVAGGVPAPSRLAPAAPGVPQAMVQGELEIPGALRGPRARTLSGSSFPGLADPRRRTSLIAAAAGGLTILAVIIALLVIRESADAGGPVAAPAPAEPLPLNEATEDEDEEDDEPPLRSSAEAVPSMSATGSAPRKGTGPWPPPRPGPFPRAKDPGF